ncbi:MAG: hypothetical protein AAGG02_21335, partial [Cyanobacteria bacterium P01_H01_bin.15]
PEIEEPLQNFQISLLETRNEILLRKMSIYLAYAAIIFQDAIYHFQKRHFHQFTATQSATVESCDGTIPSKVGSTD